MRIIDNLERAKQLQVNHGGFATHMRKVQIRSVYYLPVLLLVYHMHKTFCINQIMHVVFKYLGETGIVVGKQLHVVDVVHDEDKKHV